MAICRPRCARRAARWLQAAVLLVVAVEPRRGQTLLRADFAADTGGWENQLLANTSTGILAFVSDCW